MGMIAAFGPIWLLTGLGYAVRRAGLLDDGAAGVLGRFVFHLAMPAALFLALARTPLGGFEVRALAASAVAAAAVIGFAWWGAGRWFGRKPAERPIFGMSAGYVNSANLGIPVALQVLGNVSFLVEVVLLQTLVLTPIILAALDRGSDADGRIRLRRLATLPFRNPVILGSALGVVASATHAGLPRTLHTSLALLAAAAVPTALVALGASLHRDRASDDRVGAGALSAVTALKLVAQPLLAYAMGLVLRLPADQLLAVTVCAGLPTAQNTFLFAQEYGIGEAFATRAVLVTTTLSLGTLAATAALLA
jgi:malonate transporter